MPLRMRNKRRFAAAATVAILAASAVPAFANSGHGTLEKRTAGQYWGIDAPTNPPWIIAPGATGSVRFGLKNTGGTFNGSTTSWSIALDAPDGTTFADDSLTPVGGAAGPWTCSRDDGDRTMLCISPYTGTSIPVGDTWEWEVNVAVPAGTPAPATLTNGQAVFEYDGRTGPALTGIWTSVPMTMAVETVKLEPIPVVDASVMGGTAAVAAIGGVLYMRRRKGASLSV